MQAFVILLTSAILSLPVGRLHAPVYTHAASPLPGNVSGDVYWGSRVVIAGSSLNGQVRSQIAHERKLSSAGGFMSAQDFLFAQPVNYGVGINPHAIFAADLDGDGDNDLVTGNNLSDDVSVLLNIGNGTFQAAVNYEAGDTANSVIAADLDGDSINDLAVANWGSGDVSVLLNNGNGTFQAPVNYGAGSNPIRISAADLDGDSINDLVVANYSSDNVSILLNNGDGTFPAAVNYWAGSGVGSSFAVDLDGDGDKDLAVANQFLNNVSILLNNGDGTFQYPVFYGAGSSPWSIFAADLDGDSVNDLAVPNQESNDVSILINNGNATFRPAANYGVGMGPTAVFAADLDGDDDRDLAVVREYSLYSDNFSIFKSIGNGTFQLAADYEMGLEPTDVSSVDFDGDGYNDLAVANKLNYNVSILINCRGGGDCDNDGIANPIDNCLCHHNPSQADADADSVGDACDDCVNTPNPQQYDENSDGIGDACDGQLHIQSYSLPQGYNGVPYFYQFTAVGGVPPYNWQLFGGDIPFGCVFAGEAIGTISGAPTYNATFYFTITCFDSDAPARGDTMSLVLTVTDPPFLCGDANGNSLVNISDVVYLVQFLFGSGPAPVPSLAGDADCNGIVTIIDAVYLVNFIFGGGPEPCAACP